MMMIIKRKTVRWATDVFAPVDLKQNLSLNIRFVIERSSLNGTIKELVVTAAIFNVKGLAVDWMGRNIYWTEEVRGLIYTLYVMVYESLM